MFRNRDRARQQKGSRPVIATEAEAHAEWHRNTGQQYGCPWDSCWAPEPEFTEEELAAAEAFDLERSRREDVREANRFDVW
jgi:hypothetical protein